jgi:HEAT repeat protein
MKKLIVVLILTLMTAVLGFSSTEEVQVYEFLYNSAPNHAAQLDILQNMSQARLSGAGEFYAKALRKLLADYKNIKDVTEKNAADDQAMLLAAMLGAEKYTQAAPDLWLLVDAFSAPLVKAEALMALGKVRATNYLPQIIRVLESINASPTSDRLNGERIAFGAIISLEKFQDPSGYLPVFFASTGWYSDRIKSQATKSLPFIAQDPAPYMIQVVKGAGYDYSSKFLALRTIESSRIDNKSKAEVAVVAYTEGWRSNTNDVNMRTTLAEMRKLAITMINRYKTDDQAVYPLLERSYSYGYDATEKLNAIAALASLGTDEAARRLAKFLADLNTKRRDGNITREDEQMVRAIIPALGQTGRTNVIEGRAALISVGTSNWTNAVKALADNELKKYR